MPDLESIARLARRKGLNYTGRLSHQQVVALARAWRPEIRFHEDERFHPVDLRGLYTIPAQVFASLPVGSQAEFDIEIGGTTLAPPVLRNGDTVLGNGASVTSALAAETVNDDTVITHGKSFAASNEFFGSLTTVTMQPEPAPGDPRAPRHVPLTVRAEMRMLYEALKFELELDDLEADEEKPDDGIWRGFQVENSFFRRASQQGGGQPQPFTTSQMRKILKELVDGHDPDNRDFTAENAAVVNAESQVPSGWMFVRNAWEVIKCFGLVEYHLIYAYNDFDQYESPFGNHHEGDNEGCCVVFDRSRLNQMVDDAAQFPPESIAPHAFVTSVHEEWQGGDRLDANISVDPARARDDLVAYVARGSHATYLDAGVHDVLDFGDAFSIPFHGPTWLVIVSMLTLGLPGLIAAIAEHFEDSEDHTSNDGVSVGGPPDAPTGPLVFPADTLVTRLSKMLAGQNIYNFAEGSSDELATLGIRAYGGMLGADDGAANHSPQWENKTARYFRRLLQAVESGALGLPGPVIT